MSELRKITVNEQEYYWKYGFDDNVVEKTMLITIGVKIWKTMM